MFMVQDVSPRLHAPASMPSLHHCELLPSGTLSPDKLFLLEAALLMVFCRGNRKVTDMQGDRDRKWWGKKASVEENLKVPATSGKTDTLLRVITLPAVFLTSTLGFHLTPHTSVRLQETAQWWFKQTAPGFSQGTCAVTINSEAGANSQPAAAIHCSVPSEKSR